MHDDLDSEVEAAVAKRQQIPPRLQTGIWIAIIIAGIVVLGLATLWLVRANPTAERRNEDERLIYHLVTESDFRKSTEQGAYSPDSLSTDGFVHCAFKDSVVPLANTYFSQVADTVLVLAIDRDLLSAEVRYEQAKPVEGGRTDQFTTSDVFPHVYGPIDGDAVKGVGRLRHDTNGYIWPTHFEPIDAR
jgi:uncharacterized protein (DUF952 family)